MNHVMKMDELQCFQNLFHDNSNARERKVGVSKRSADAVELI